MNFCRRTDKIPYFRLDRNNAQECLEKIGYGIEECKETQKYDGRYGRVLDNCIEFGIIGFINEKWNFGDYVVLDDDEMTWGQYSEEEFLKYFEPIK